MMDYNPSKNLHRPRNPWAFRGSENGITITEARQTIAPVRVPEAKQEFGLPGSATSGRAAVDVKAGLKIVEVPDEQHPLTKTLRLITADIKDGHKHQAMIVYNSDTYEIEKIYVPMDQHGNPDRIAMGLVARQHPMFADKNGELAAGIPALDKKYGIQPEALSIGQHRWARAVHANTQYDIGRFPREGTVPPLPQAGLLPKLSHGPS